MRKAEDVAREMLAEHADIDESKVTDEARLAEDFAMDSLDAVEIAIDLEQEFGIDVDDDRLEKVVTVADLIKLVQEASDAEAA